MARLMGQTEAPAGFYLTASLNARLQPLDRGEHYEDPLHEALEAKGLGAVTGGGTALDPELGIRSCDLEIRVENTSDETLAFVRERLEALGAPKGSRLIVEDGGREIAFGVNEGLALYLNGTDLPDQVYQDCDAGELVEQLQEKLGTKGAFQSYWEGERETALFFYGPSYDTMVAAIRDMLDTYPLCQKSRLEQIA